MSMIILIRFTSSMLSLWTISSYVYLFRMVEVVLDLSDASFGFSGHQHKATYLSYLPKPPHKHSCY
ncbi:hypothetical protein F4776DRAFT_649000 [Hypoxylon sp. NC0597]|nr:hypothetical protein F4776DRAFT_649000 [Hypoxylon sp. NC0597]